MANRYRRKEVLEALRAMIAPICGDIHTCNRETVKTTSNAFVIIKLPQGIRPYADTHNIAYVQIQIFTKDISNGVESVQRTEDMVDAISRLFPYGDDLIRCNETPVLLDTKTDGMGYHSTIIQFKIAIKL